MPRVLEISGASKAPSVPGGQLAASPSPCCSGPWLIAAFHPRGIPDRLQWLLYGPRRSTGTGRRATSGRSTLGVADSSPLGAGLAVSSSHLNDGGFWIVKDCLGVTVNQTRGARGR
jgi:hypothetical protein